MFREQVRKRFSFHFDCCLKDWCLQVSETIIIAHQWGSPRDSLSSRWSFNLFALCTSNMSRFGRTSPGINLFGNGRKSSNSKPTGIAGTFGSSNSKSGRSTEVFGISTSNPTGFGGTFGSSSSKSGRSTEGFGSSNSKPTGFEGTFGSSNSKFGRSTEGFGSSNFNSTGFAETLSSSNSKPGRFAEGFGNSKSGSFTETLRNSTFKSSDENSDPFSTGPVSGFFRGPTGFSSNGKFGRATNAEDRGSFGNRVSARFDTATQNGEYGSGFGSRMKFRNSDKNSDFDVRSECGFHPRWPAASFGGRQQGSRQSYEREKQTESGFRDSHARKFKDSNEDGTRNNFETASLSSGGRFWGKTEEEDYNPFGMGFGERSWDRTEEEDYKPFGGLHESRNSQSSFRRTAPPNGGRHGFGRRGFGSAEDNRNPETADGTPTEDKCKKTAVLDSSWLQGVVTRVSAQDAYVWPMNPTATEQICIKESGVPEAERLQLAEWVQFRINEATGNVEEYRKYECDVLTFISTGSDAVWVRTELSNVRRVCRVNSKRFHYIGHSSLVGRVGVFFSTEELTSDKTYNKWITRRLKEGTNVTLEDGKELSDVYWCVSKQSTISVGQTQKEADSGTETMPSPSRSQASTPPSQGLDTGNKNEAGKQACVPIGEASGGVIVARTGNIGFVWSAEYGEGLITTIEKFEVGDWVSFTTSSIKSTGSSSYTARDLQRLEPLYPAFPSLKGVRVHVPARIYFRGTSQKVYAEWFGEIEDENEVLKSKNYDVKKRYMVIVERRRKKGTVPSRWTLVSVRPPLDEKIVKKPVLGSTPNYAVEMLRYLYENDLIRQSVNDRSLSASIGKFLGIPPAHEQTPNSLSVQIS